MKSLALVLPFGLLIFACGDSGSSSPDGGDDLPDSSYPVPDAPPDPGCPAMACGGNVQCVDGSGLQAAIDGAADGGIIQVGRGTYDGDLTISGKTVVLRGGFPGGGDFSSCSRTANPTTLDGSGSDAVVVLLDAADSVVENFVITGGTGHDDGGRWRGGGVYVSGGAPLIAYNRIENNTVNNADNGDYSAEHGGGIYCDGDCRIFRNTIRGNIADRGAGVGGSGNVKLEGNTIENNIGQQDHSGGVYLVGGSFEVVDNFIAGNEIGVTAEYNYGWGGGVYIGDGSTAMLRGTIVTDNLASSIGSGVFVDNGARATLVNELYYKNRCSGTGGAGFYADNLDTPDTGSIVEIVNSTIVDHDCPGVEGGNGVFIEGAGTEVTITNSIFWGNAGEDFYARGGETITVDYSITEQGWAGTSNLTMDPDFANPGSGDYHLRSTAGRWDPSSGSWVQDSIDSPGIDSGDPSSSYQAEPTPNGGRINMGHHGNTGEASKSN